MEGNKQNVQVKLVKLYKLDENHFGQYNFHIQNKFLSVKTLSFDLRKKKKKKKKKKKQTTLLSNHPIWFVCLQTKYLHLF